LSYIGIEMCFHSSRVGFTPPFEDGYYKAKYGLCVACDGEFSQALSKWLRTSQDFSSPGAYSISACVQADAETSQRQAGGKLYGA